MPLIDPSKPQRIDIEGEEGAWVEMVPLTAGDLELLQVDEAGGVKATRAALERCVRAWSYDAPVNGDSIKLLAIDTFVWMGAALMRVSGIRSPDQKNVSGESSTQPSATAPESPESSPT